MELNKASQGSNTVLNLGGYIWGGTCLTHNNNNPGSLPAPVARDQSQGLLRKPLVHVGLSQNYGYLIGGI